MLFQEGKMVAYALVYSQNRRMSTGGGHSWRVAETIQNNAPIVSLCNFIGIGISQVRF